MAHKIYPFIDIAVLDAVRARMLDADAIAILSNDLQTVIWANGPGAALFGHDDIEAVRGADSGLSFGARRQIAATPGFPDVGTDRAILVRFTQGVTSRAIGFLVSTIRLPGGETALLLSAPATAGERGNAELAISGIAEAGHFAALIDADGAILAASRGLDALGLDDGALAALAADANHEADRLAKRPLPAGALLYPAGIARLADQPARHLVIVVDAPQQATPEVASEPEPHVSTPTTSYAETVARAASAFAPAPHDTDSWYFADAAPRAAATPDTVPAALIEEQDDGVDDIMLDALPEDEAEPPSIPSDDAEDPTRTPGQIAEQGIAAGSEAQEADEPAMAETTETSTPTRAYADDAGQSWEQDNAPSPVAWENLPLPVVDDIVAEAETAGEPESVADGAGGFPALPKPDEPAEQASAPQHTADQTVASPGEAPAADPFVPDLAAGPVRFVWRTDALGRFSMISDEFAGAVGKRAADVIGRSFRDVSLVFGLDPDGEIAGLLARRDTWSGRSVMWPIEGTDLSVPVDLAALPVYARDRSFEGFRGFGVVRVGDAVVDPEAIGLSLTSAPSEPPAEPTSLAATPAAGEPPARDPFKGELPAIAVDDTPERRLSDKVIRLAEHRPATPERTLSPGEKIAFREIGARLKDAGDDGDASQDGGGSEDQDDHPAAPAISGEAPTSDERETSEQSLAPAEDDDFAPTAMGPDASDEVSVADTGDSDDKWIDQNPALDDVVAPAADEMDDRFAYVAADEAPAPDASGEPVYVENGLASDETPSDDRAVKADEAFVTPDGGDAADMAGELANGEPEDVDQSDDFIPSAFSQATDDERATAGIDTSILARLPVPVLIHSADTLHYANQEFFDLTGYVSVLELEQAGGLDVLFADEEHDATRDPSDHRRRLRTHGGQEFPVEALLQSVPWHGRKALLLALKATVPPQTAALPEELAELEARVLEMRTILDTATDGIVILGNDGTIRSISRPAEALFGFDTAAVAGKPFVSLFAVESQRAARDYLTGLSDNGVASVLNDGREVIGREAQGRFIPLFMTIGKLPNQSGYCAVLRDITQWKRAEEELTQARAEAERSSSQKTDFLARISHEIRTPLNAIIGFSELMIDEKFGPIVNDRYRDYLRDINRSGNHVLDLVNDLLDISKIEAGEQEMAYEAVSLNETLAEAVAMMQPQANRNRVIIRSSFASKLPEVVADLRSIRQIALNLLSNAVRYTQAGGQVIVSTAYEPTGDVVMRVRDTGVGMSQGEIEQALKPFKQINALKRSRGDGTGLGLPLTKAMVEANRARFAISSAPAEGTMVEITFPSTRVLAG